jgi:hypothetical protein
VSYAKRKELLVFSDGGLKSKKVEASAQKLELFDRFACGTARLAFTTVEANAMRLVD